jgi:hypothetical protein
VGFSINSWALDEDRLGEGNILTLSYRLSRDPSSNNVVIFTVDVQGLLLRKVLVKNRPFVFPVLVIFVIVGFFVGGPDGNYYFYC